MLGWSCRPCKPWNTPTPVLHSWKHDGYVHFWYTDINIKVRSKYVSRIFKDWGAGIKRYMAAGLVLLSKSGTGQTWSVWGNKWENSQKNQLIGHAENWQGHVWTYSDCQYIMTLQYTKQSICDFIYQSCCQMLADICNDWQVTSLFKCCHESGATHVITR